MDALPEAQSEGLELGVRMPFHTHTVARPGFSGQRTFRMRNLVHVPSRARPRDA
jgi:hypothetical protein